MRLNRLASIATVVIVLFGAIGPVYARLEQSNPSGIRIAIHGVASTSGLDDVEVYERAPVKSTQGVSQVQWVPYNGSIPSNAVVGGSENGHPLFVGRMSLHGGLHPGKVLPGGFCNVGWGGKEYSINSGFEILTAPPNTTAWVEYGGSVPANAIVGGYNSSGGADKLYVAKHAYKGGEHCGKLWANSCNLGWGGSEIVLKEKIYILVETMPIKAVGKAAANTVDAANLALGKACTQSSRSQWSNNEQGAVDGVKNGSFGFHTGPGPAWWQVDLGTTCVIDHVLIFNRTDCCAERARTIQVLLSTDGVNFVTAYSHNGSHFGGILDGNPLDVRLNGTSARYVRLQITSGDMFHLDEVEVYGSAGSNGVTVARSDGQDLNDGQAMLGTLLDYSKYKINLPNEIGILLTFSGVSQEDTDLACSVLGAVAYVVQSAQSNAFTKSQIQDLLQKVQQLKLKKLRKVPFFENLITNGEKDLIRLLGTMK